MDVDTAAMASAVVPYVTTAVGAYGAAVLGKLEEAAADATVGLGSALLRRLLHRKESEPVLAAAVRDLADDPADEDRVSALRLQIRKILADDAGMAKDVAGMLRNAGVSVVAAAPRSVAAQHIGGVVSTGDNARITR